MATRKQRSRRAKTFRHDYAFVTEDEEGNEVELTGADVRSKKEPGAKAKAKPGTKSASSSRAGREPPPPSWNRALKRGLPWGIAAGLGVTVLTNGPIVIGVIYGIAFVPLMYFTDGFVYRRWERRKTTGPNRKSG
jgi:hypothetical protein